MSILLGVALYLAISWQFTGGSRKPRRILVALLWPAALVVAIRRAR